MHKEHKHKEHRRKHHKEHEHHHHHDYCCDCDCDECGGHKEHAEAVEKGQQWRAEIEKETAKI
jgi:hypothetical protein